MKIKYKRIWFYLTQKEINLLIAQVTLKPLNDFNLNLNSKITIKQNQLSTIIRHKLGLPHVYGITLHQKMFRSKGLKDTATDVDYINLGIKEHNEKFNKRYKLLPQQFKTPNVNNKPY